MFTQLTTEHCLYVIKQDLLTRFLYCSEQQFLEGYVSTASSLDPLNNHAVVLQIWCMLNEDELRLILNPEKMLMYSIDCYILKLLRTDPKIQLFINSRIWNQRDHFALAYYLACATLQWGDEVIAAHKKSLSLFDTNQSRDYFTLSDTENLAHNEQHDFYHFQKMIVQAMSMDYNSTKRWDRFIEETLVLVRKEIGRERIREEAVKGTRILAD